MTFGSFRAHGSIQHGLIHHDVRKQGLFSEHWTLERHGQRIAEAHKDSFIRRYTVSADCGVFVVQAEGIFTRDFEILCGESVAGTIRPAHGFTRRAFIHCSDAVPEICQLFAFWLTALSWKRASESSA